MARTSAADLARALRGTDFPATTEDLVNKAKENGAAEEIIETIRELPEDTEYQSMADVEHEFSQAQKAD